MRATSSEAVLLYRMRRARAGLPAPLLSYGFYWRRRPYVCYRFVRPPGGSTGGVEVARRFDVVGRVQLVATPAGGGPAELRFEDLLLDLWVRRGAGPGGADELRWEDEDELRVALDGGLLSPAQAARIERARTTLQHSVASGRLPPLPDEAQALLERGRGAPEPKSRRAAVTGDCAHQRPADPLAGA